MFVAARRSCAEARAQTTRLERRIRHLLRNSPNFCTEPSNSGHIVVVVTPNCHL